MIVKKESPLGLYKGVPKSPGIRRQIRLTLAFVTGLGAVATGIVPKMAIRFAAFERYKDWLTPTNGRAGGASIFLGSHIFTVWVNNHLRD